MSYLAAAAALVSVLTISAIAAAPACAQLEDEGPFELQLWLENDNLFLGAYPYIAGRDNDGSDLGRTHALGLAVASRIAPRLALRFALTTALYTRALDATPINRGATVPIEFLELDRLYGGFAWRGARSPLHARGGFTVELANESVVGPGAIGQQDAFHDFCTDVLGCDTWRFDAHPRDVPLRPGVAWTGAAGGHTTLKLLPWLALRVAGDVGLRLATITAGSAFFVEGRAAIVIGDPNGVRFVVRGQHRVDAWLFSEGAMMRATIDVRLHLGPVALRVAVHRYEGGQNEAYYRYAEPNTTMTIALSTRL